MKSTYSLVKSMKSEELSDRPCLLSLCLVPPHLISPENVAKYSRVPSRDESNTKHRIHVLTFFGNFCGRVTSLLVEYRCPSWISGVSFALFGMLVLFPPYVSYRRPWAILIATMQNPRGIIGQHLLSRFWSKYCLLDSDHQQQVANLDRQLGNSSAVLPIILQVLFQSIIPAFQSILETSQRAHTRTPKTSRFCTSS